MAKAEIVIGEMTGGSNEYVQKGTPDSDTITCGFQPSQIMLFDPAFTKVDSSTTKTFCGYDSSTMSANNRFWFCNDTTNEFRTLNSNNFINTITSTGFTIGSSYWSRLSAGTVIVCVP